MLSRDELLSHRLRAAARDVGGPEGAETLGAVRRAAIARRPKVPLSLSLSRDAEERETAALFAVTSLGPLSCKDLPVEFELECRERPQVDAELPRLAPALATAHGTTAMLRKAAEAFSPDEEQGQAPASEARRTQTQQVLLSLSLERPPNVRSIRALSS